MSGEGSSLAWVEPRPRLASDLLVADEELLREGRPAVRVGTFGAPAVSVGVSHRRGGGLEERAEALGLPVVQRSSGGGPLLHLEGDLFWSLTLPRDHPLAGPGFVHRYEELGAGWVAFLARSSVASSWECPPGRTEEYCLLSSRGRVLETGGRVLGGASQHATSRALLHHGFVPRTLDRGHLSSLFHLGPEDLGRLTCLEEVGVRLGGDALRTLAGDLAAPLQSLMRGAGSATSPVTTRGSAERPQGRPG